MRAILRTRFGRPDVLVIREIPEPEPKDGHVTIQRVLADGVTAFYREAGLPDALVLLLLDLFLDYANNVKRHPCFQEYFRTAKPPLLAIWGKHDTYFIPAGAQAFRRDNPAAVVRLLDTGHFALETHVEEIALAIQQFLPSGIRRP